MLNFDVDGRNFQSDLAINKKKKKPQTNVFLPPSLLTDVTAEWGESDMARDFVNENK